jgi:hypothetical protein
MNDIHAQFAKAKGDMKVFDKACSELLDKAFPSKK